jgi:hypothetical protein
LSCCIAGARRAARQRHQGAGHGRDQRFDANLLGIGPALAHRQRAAGPYDIGAERKALALRRGQQIALELDGQSPPASM